MSGISANSLIPGADAQGSARAQLREESRSPAVAQMGSLPSRLAFLIPTVAALALSRLAFAGVPLGVGVGLGNYIFMLLGNATATPEEKATLDQNVAEMKVEVPEIRTLLDNPYVLCLLGAPLEGVARGVPLILAHRAILWLIPATAASIVGSYVTVAAAIASLAMAVLISIMFRDVINKGATSRAQLEAGIGQLATGILALHFGFGLMLSSSITTMALWHTALAMNKTS